MENMETNDIVANEAIKEITEAVSTGKSGLKTAAKVGVIGAASITAWEFAVKPAFRWVKGKITGRKTTKKSKKPQEDEIDLEEMDLDDIPEIDK